VKLRNKKMALAEMHEGHINNRQFAEFRIIEIDVYDIQPAPKKSPEKKNNKQEKDISEKAVGIRSLR